MTVFATAQDKTLRELTRPNAGKLQDVSRLEQNVTLNQLEMMRGNKVFFAGVGET